MGVRQMDKDISKKENQCLIEENLPSIRSIYYVCSVDFSFILLYFFYSLPFRMGIFIAMIFFFYFTIVDLMMEQSDDFMKSEEPYLERLMVI